MINRFVAYHESSHRYEIRKVSLYQASTPIMANFDDCDFFMWVEELRLMLHQWFGRLDFVTLIQDLRLHPSMNLGELDLICRSINMLVFLFLVTNNLVFHFSIHRSINKESTKGC
ncbi:unnamed protein product [Brassica oleracea]